VNLRFLEAGGCPAGAHPSFQAVRRNEISEQTYGGRFRNMITQFFFVRIRGDRRHPDRDCGPDFRRDPEKPATGSGARAVSHVRTPGPHGLPCWGGRIIRHR